MGANRLRPRQPQASLRPNRTGRSTSSASLYSSSFWKPWKRLFTTHTKAQPSASHRQPSRSVLAGLSNPESASCKSFSLSVSLLKAIRIFFRTNKSTCLEWFARVRFYIISLSMKTGNYEIAVRQSYEFIQYAQQHSQTSVSRLAVAFAEFFLSKTLFLKRVLSSSKSSSIW
jgi:hypothetical protein